jgi:hypothetical protein
MQNENIKPWRKNEEDNKRNEGKNMEPHDP